MCVVARSHCAFSPINHFIVEWCVCACVCASGCGKCNWIPTRGVHRKVQRIICNRIIGVLWNTPAPSFQCIKIIIKNIVCPCCCVRRMRWRTARFGGAWWMRSNCQRVACKHSNWLLVHTYIVRWRLPRSSFRFYRHRHTYLNNVFGIYSSLTAIRLHHNLAQVATAIERQIDPKDNFTCN